jgi:hypothetical protein
MRLRRFLFITLLLVLGAFVAQAGEDPALVVEGLGFAPGSREQLVWDPAPSAGFYGLYRGRVAPGGLFAFYNHRCLATEIAAPAAEDPERPMPGAAFYYLVNGLRPGASPEAMSWGPLGTAAVVRPEGDLPCGRRVFLDPAATGGGDGSSWEDAYTAAAAAAAHASPERRSLEIWMTGAIEESLAVPERFLVFYGGFAGDEQHAWERRPEDAPFSWSAAAGEDQLSEPSFTYRVMRVIVDGIAFRRGRHPLYLCVSGARVEVRRSRFDEQEAEAIYFHPPTDNRAGVDLFVDNALFGSSGIAVIPEGGETFDVRIHRSRFDQGGISLDVGAGTLGSEGRLEILGSELRDAEELVSIGLGCFSPEEALVRLDIASSLLAGAGTDAVAIRIEPGNGRCELEGSIVHSTISDAAGSGVRCRLLGTKGAARCDLDLQWNLITFSGEYGVAEPDDSAPGHESHFGLIGNDLYGNATMYLRDGTTPLDTIEQVNEPWWNWGNRSEDPLYVDRTGGDYHLGPLSPFIDACMEPPRPWVLVDVDGQPRLRRASGSRLRADFGADER